MAQLSIPLPQPADESPSRVIHVNARTQVHQEGEVRALVVGGIPVLTWSVDDAAAAAYAMVLQVRGGFASPTEVARAHGAARMTVYRAQARFDERGLPGLVRGTPGPKQARVLRQAATRRMVVLKRRGVTNAAIAAAFGVTESGIRKALQRIGYQPPTPVQGALLAPPEAAPVEESPALADGVADGVADAVVTPPVPPSVACEVLSATALQGDPAGASAGTPLPTDDVDEAGPAARELADLPPRGMDDDIVDEADPAVRTSADLPPRGINDDDVDGVGPAVRALAALHPRGMDDAGVDEVSPAVRESVATGQADALRAGDPWDRSVDRAYARLGLINGAPPQFGTCQGVTGLGVLLALPALMATGVFDIASQVYGRVGAAFFGVRSVFVCLSLMALLRITRAEHLRHGQPPMLGRVLGLDRAPEVKTLRRNVAELAHLKKSEAFQRALAQRRVAAASEAMGFLYVDGHVRVYSGQTTLPKIHVTRMRLSMPATVDHWVNDRAGDPLLVLTATPTASLTKEMRTIVTEVRQVLGSRRATIVFDRGGWSPKLFAELIGDHDFDILTYRKGHIPPVDTTAFRQRDGDIDGRHVVYQLAERPLTLAYTGGTLTLREVVRLSEDGTHQTSIVTNRQDLTDVEIAYRMFARWRQENFFKYMRDEFEIDALWNYGTEDADANRDVPNPARTQAARTLREARAEVVQLERALGAGSSLKTGSKRPTLRGFRSAKATVGPRLRAAHARVATLRAAMRDIPKRTTAHQAANGEPVLQLKTEAKRLTDTIKSVACQAETALFRLLRPHYSRCEDEGRKLIASAMHLSGDIAVGPGELRLTLEPAASPNRTKAIARLCDELNATETVYPGTRLRLRYAIRNA